jgi:hypothetical protein
VAFSDNQITQVSEIYTPNDAETNFSSLAYGLQPRCQQVDYNDLLTSAAALATLSADAFL